MSKGVLGGMDAATFLRDYWQKKPLLIRQAFPGFACPISGDELAGLACEPDVESRIVEEKKNGKPWQVSTGPFDDDRFGKLPKKKWTLLVQGLDHWVPEVADLLDHFRFIPNWRIDDVMASYAVDGGSVGPHYDYYDVFLLQGSGRRRWQVGGHCDELSPRLDGTPLRILSEFETMEEWVLEPGDMLYLPPQIAHFGVAQGDDCITLSIGFRSPTHEQLVASFADHVCQQMPAEAHLDEPDLPLQENPGEIGTTVMSHLRSVLLKHLDQPVELARWFGQYSTEPKSDAIVTPVDDPYTAKSWRQHLTAAGVLRRNEGSRFAFHALPQHLLLFVDGECFELTGMAAQLAKFLSAHPLVAADELSPYQGDPTSTDLLLTLTNQGSLYFP